MLSANMTTTTPIPKNKMKVINKIGGAVFGALAITGIIWAVVAHNTGAIIIAFAFGVLSFMSFTADNPETFIQDRRGNRYEYPENDKD